jgi:hypothetical protein
MTDTSEHVLVVANETVAGSALVDAVRRHAEAGEALVTVVCPVQRPREGYVVYEDTRRASAGRRLDRTLSALREAGVRAHGMVTESDPVDAVRDALAQLEPPPTRIVLSTHPLRQSGWLRKNVLDRIRRVAGELPVEHVVVDVLAERGEANVLVVANETVLGRPLLDRIKERAARSPASFMIICPQSDPTVQAHPDAERRLKRALAGLRAAGVDAHGQIAHPDPYTAAVHAVQDERTDEIIVSTFPGQQTSSWLRGDLVERVRKATGLPVDHVEVAPDELVETAVP